MDDKSGTSPRKIWVVYSCTPLWGNPHGVGIEAVSETEADAKVALATSYLSFREDQDEDGQMPDAHFYIEDVPLKQ